MRQVFNRPSKTSKIIPNFAGGYVDYYDKASLQENVASELINVNSKRPPNLTSTFLRERKKTFTNEIIECISKYREEYIILIYIDLGDAGKTKIGYVDPDLLVLNEIGELTTGVSGRPTYYQLANYNDNLYIGFNDKLYKWDGTTFSSVATIPAEWDVNLLAVNGTRLYASKEGESSLFFSDNGNDDFTDPEGSGIIPVESSKGLGITGMTEYSDAIIVFTAGSMHKLIGNGPNDYWFKEISSKIGCVDNESIVEVKGYLYFRSWDGIYVYDGSNIPTKIDTPIERTIAEVSQVDSTAETKAYRDNISFIMYYGKYGVEYDTLLGRWYRRDTAHLADDGDLIGLISLDNETYSIVENDSTPTTRYLCKEDTASSVSTFVAINSILNPTMITTANWIGFRCTLSAAANILSAVNTSTSGSFNVYQNGPEVVAGEWWFFYSKIKSILFQLERVELYADGYGYLGGNALVQNPVIGQEYEVYSKKQMVSSESPGFFMVDFFKETSTELAEVDIYGIPGVYGINLSNFNIEELSENELLLIVQAAVTLIEQMENTYEWISGEYDYFDQFKQVYLEAVRVSLESYRGDIKISLLKNDGTEDVVYEKYEYTTSGSILLFDEVEDFYEEIKILPSKGIMREPFRIKISGTGTLDAKKVTFLTRFTGKLFLR